MTDAAEGGSQATEGEHESGLVVVEQDEQQEQDEHRSEIDRPDKLLRLAGTVQGLLNEVRTTDLDEAGRKRLAQVHRSVLEELGTVVSDDLVEELEAMDVDGIDADATGGELRVAQAQLAGWLEGLFHGIRASVANKQAMLQQRQGGQGGQPQQGGATGQYL
jgi:dsDNA-binding SOS-regulon protein